MVLGAVGKIIQLFDLSDVVPAVGIVYFPSQVCSRSSDMQPVPVRWMRKLRVLFLERPERMACAQPGWSMSPVSGQRQS
jgi:hypothetical protein